MNELKAKVRTVWATVRREWGWRKKSVAEKIRDWRETRAYDKNEQAYIKHYTSLHERLLMFDQREGVKEPYLLYIPRQVLTDVFGGLHRIVPEPNKDHVMWLITWVGAGAGGSLALGLVGVFMGVQLTTAILGLLLGAGVGAVGAKLIRNPTAVQPMWVAKREEDVFETVEDEDGNKKVARVSVIHAIDPIHDIGIRGEGSSEFLYKRTNRSTVGNAIKAMRKQKEDWKESIPLGILAALNGGLVFGLYLFITG